jgi:sulfatase maturation enzyme AslB (radical SAM superfamily)
MYPKLKYLIRRLVDHNYELSVTTNGTNVNELRKILDMVICLLTARVHIRLSLDGWKTLHESIRGLGTYDEVLKSAREINSMYGNIRLNTVVFKQPTNLHDLIHELSCFRVADWALITPVMRNIQNDMTFSRMDTLGNISEWRREINKLLPNTYVQVWDYLSHPNGGIVIEADGTITMPGIMKCNDVIIGNIETVRADMIADYIKRRMMKDPVSFFKYAK